jgi:phage-related protein
LSSPGTRNTVGKVGVRVVPDTSKFHKEVKSYLERIEKQLELTIRVEFNEAQALAELKKLMRVLEENAELTIPVKFDQRSINKAASSVRGMANPLKTVEETFKSAATSVARFGNNVVEARQRIAGAISDLVFWVKYTAQTQLNSQALAQHWQRLVKAGQAVSATFRKIPTMAALAKNLALSATNGAKLRAIRLGNFVKDLGDAQTYVNAFYRSMEFVGESYERAAKKIKNFRLTDVTKALSNGFRRVGTAAANAGRSITRNLGRAVDGSVRGITKGLSKGLSGLGTAFGKVGRLMGSFGSSLASITRTGWIFIAVLGLAAPLVGVLAAAIAALPAALAVVGAGIGVVMLGLDGIKKAATAAQPAFNNLKKAVSGTFAKELTPVFKQIGQKFLPAITKSTQAVAVGISEMGKGFTDVILSSGGLTQINTILGNIAKFFTAMRPTIAEVVRWFLNLAEIGSGGLAGTAASLGKFFQAWNQIVMTASQTGVLQQALSGLGQVLGSVGGLFLELFRTGLQAMSQLGGPMSAFISSIGSIFAALMPVLTVISKLFFDVGSALASALVPAITALTPSIQLLGDLLGQALVGAIQALMPIITPLAQIIGDVLVMALKAIQPIIPPVVAFLKQLGEIVGQLLLQAFTALQPLLQVFMNAVTEILTALTPLLPVIAELAQTLLKAFLDILVQLMPTITDLANTLIPILVEAIKLLVPAFVEILNAVIPILPELTKLAGIIVDALIPFMELLKDVVDFVWPAIKAIIVAALGIIQGVIEVVMGVITGDWSRAWDGIQQILKAAWDFIYKAVTKGIDSVVDFVKSFPGKVLSALGNLGRLLFSAGESLVQGLWDGIKAVWGKVTGWIKSGLQGIRNLFPFSPAKEGPFSGKGYTLYSGQALAEDWAKGIRDGIPEAQKAVEDMMRTSDVAAAEWSGVVTSDGFGSIGDHIRAAMESWEIRIDSNGVARMVNKANFRKERRG